MTTTDQAPETPWRIEDSELHRGPCPPWCVHSHHQGDRSHGSRGRSVTLSTEPSREMSWGGILDEHILINGWFQADSKAAIQIEVTGARRHRLTADEAVKLAADLLAAVDQVQSDGEDLHLFEKYAADQHVKELLVMRTAQLRNVRPADGAIVDDGWAKHFFCRRFRVLSGFVGKGQVHRDGSKWLS
jgi:hypothetical protein